MKELFQKILKQGKSIFVVLTGIFFITSFVSMPVNAQVAGFAECDFTSAQSNPTGGPEILQRCISSVLNFIFVIALFLIVFRIGIAAFNNINPSSDGNAIKNSITAVSDVITGVFLIIAAPIILSILNPALLNLNIFNLGDLGSIVSQNTGNNGGGNNGNGNNGGSSNPGGGSGSGGSNNSGGGSNNGSGNNNGGSGSGGGASNSGGGSGSNNGNGSGGGNNGSENGTNWQDGIDSPQELQTALDAYKENNSLITAKDFLDDFYIFDTLCRRIFIPIDDVEFCQMITDDYTEVIAEIREELSLPITEDPLRYDGELAVTSEIEVVSITTDSNIPSTISDDETILTIEYLPALDSTGLPVERVRMILEINSCIVNLGAGDIIRYQEAITQSSSCVVNIINKSTT